MPVLLPAKLKTECVCRVTERVHDATGWRLQLIGSIISEEEEGQRGKERIIVAKGRGGKNLGIHQVLSISLFASHHSV